MISCNKQFTLLNIKIIIPFYHSQIIMYNFAIPSYICMANKTIVRQPDYYYVVKKMYTMYSQNNYALR